MKILLISLSFPPDNSPNAYVLTPLVAGLVERGHQITVLTTFPHRGIGRIYEGYQGKLWALEQQPDLRIHRLWVYVPRCSEWRPGAALRWLSFNLPVTPVSMLTGKHDVILTLSPPFTLGLTAWLAAAVRRVPFVYNAQDIYPDVIIQQGLLPEGRVTATIERVCRFIYRRAAAVTVLSEGFRQNLIEKGVDPAKLYVIPNVVDTDTFRPHPRHNPFAERYSLDGKFVVMYAGNVGDSLGIETLFEAARLLRRRDDIQFVVGGRGSALPRLKAMCRDAGLNVRFLPFQPLDALPLMYASSDLQLVIQRSGISRASVPMKAYAIMSSGRPLLLSADLDGETATLVRQAECGLSVQPEDPAALASAIEQMAADPEQLSAWGANGRRFAEEHFSKEAVVEAYDRLLQQVVK